jgi:hypothetical protein
MKKILILTVLMLAAFFAFANNYRGDDDNYRFEFKNTIDKTFDVGANPELVTDGKYSDFIITTWDQPQIEFSVKVTVKSDDEKKAEAKFNSINIVLEKVGNKVIARTEFGEYKYKTFNGSIAIKYNIKVPKDVAMDLETKYGDITIDEARRKLEVDIKYGDFKADNLMIDTIKNNQINVKYGNVNIENVNKIGMSLDYGDAKINKCDYIDATVKYGKIFITELNHCMLEIKYSNARIEQANKVNFTNVAYSDVKLKNVKEKLTADLKYSDMSATVTSLTPKVTIDGAYSDANLFLNEDAAFNYNLRSSYGDITFKGFFDAKSINGNGSYGEGERGFLDISVKYGDVDIRKNK